MQRAKLIFFIVLLVSFVSTGFLQAQKPKVLRIIIQEEGLQPLTGANIVVYKPGEDTYLDYCISDENGFCEFRDLADSLYLVKASFVGFKTFESEIKMEESSITVRTITLEVSRSELEEVLVLGNRDITTGEVGITRVTAEDLSRIPSLSIEGDLMAYIQTLPGIITIGDQGGDVYIRGGTPAQNLVLIDNIPIVKPFHISNLFSAFPEQVINSVDIFSGGFDNEYMGSTSAVIDATLKTGNFKRYSSSVSFSPYISTLFFEGPVNEGSRSLMVNGRLSTIDRFSGYLGNEQRDLKFYDFIGKYSIQGEGLSCNLTGILTNDRGRINERRENFLTWSNSGFGARCFGYDDKFAHPYEVSIGFSRYINTEGSESETTRKASVSHYYMRFDLEEYALGLKVDYGFSILMQSFTANLDDRFTLAEDFKRVVPVLQLYAKTKWPVNEYLDLQPSIGSQFSTLTVPTIEPRFRILYKPFADNRFEISAATGLYYQLHDAISDERDAGTTFKVYRPNDFDDPLPSAVHAMIGLRNKFGSKWATNFEVYYKKHKNIPVSKWQPIAKLETETALANSENYGMDLGVRYEGEITFAYLGYGWSRSEYSAARDDLGAWILEPIFTYAPPHDQRHKLNTILSFEIGKFTSSLTWELGSGLPYTKVLGFDLEVIIPLQDPIAEPGIAKTLFARPYGERLPYYHRLDVSVRRSFDISGHLSMITELGCINVYDRSNVFYVDLNLLERVDQTPILPYAGIKMAFK